MSFLEIYPPFCTLRLGGHWGKVCPRAWLRNRTARSDKIPYRGRERQQTCLRGSYRTEAVGGNKVRGRALRPTSSSVRMQNCHEIRTLSIALPNGDGVKEWRLERHGFYLLISSSTQWEVFLSNYRSRWKLQRRQDLWPRWHCLCVVIKSYF